MLKSWAVVFSTQTDHLPLKRPALYWPGSPLFQNVLQQMADKWSNEGTDNEDPRTATVISIAAMSVAWARVQKEAKQNESDMLTWKCISKFWACCFSVIKANIKILIFYSYILWKLISQNSGIYMCTSLTVYYKWEFCITVLDKWGQHHRRNLEML